MTAPGTIRITLGRVQADEVSSEMGSGSESFAEAIDNGLTLIGRVLTIPPSARAATATAIGIRYDVAEDNRASDPWFSDDASRWNAWTRLGVRLAGLGLRGLVTPLRPGETA